MKEPLKDKTCLITGASSGVGYYTALALAGMDATIIMVSSKEEKLNEKVKEVVRQTGNNHIYAMPCDLSSQAAVRRLAAEVLSSHERLDILINNAGVFRDSRNVSEDGYEWTFTVNHLAPFLLTNLLLARMLYSSPARIINLVSSFYKSGRIDLDDLHFEKNPYDGLAAYNRSKLANVMFTVELARKLEGTGVTVNASDPLGTRSSICKGNKGFYSFIWNTIQPFLRSGKNGAQTTIYLASSKEVEQTSGKYFKHRRLYQSSKAYYDAGLSSGFWAECERLTRVSFDLVINKNKNKGQYKNQGHDH